MKYSLEIKIFFISLIIITIQSILNSIFTLPKGDQTNFLYAAEQLYNGGKLGLEVWEVKPPLHLLIISTIYIFKKSLIAVHVGELVLNLLAIFIFYISSKTKLNKNLIYCSSIFYIFFYYFGTPSYERFQVEGLFNPILIISISLLFSEKKILHILSGIFFSFFFLSKIVGIFFLLIIFYFFKKNLIRFFIGTLIGIFVIIILINHFGSIHQVIDDLNLTIFFRDYSSQLSFKNIILENILGNLFFSLFFFIKISAPILFFIIFFSDYSNVKIKLRHIVNCLIILLPPLFIVILQSKFYLYHFYYFIPCVAYIYGFYFSKIFRLDLAIFNKKIIHKVTLILFVIIFPIFIFFFAEKIDQRVSKFKNRFSYLTNFYSFSIETKYFYNIIFKDLSLNDYRALIFENFDINFNTFSNLISNKNTKINTSELKISKILKLSNYVKDNTTKNEKVLYLVNGYFPYYVERSSYNKYFTPHPFKKIYKNNNKLNKKYEDKILNFEKSLLQYEGKFIILSNWFPIEKVDNFKDKLNNYYFINKISFEYGKEKFYLYERLN
ncbi:MAG: hypothetical protein CL454_11445 [Acidimicrobiaceae bacterium]|nr:hypothetical protein [Acidimicrobiaceae bacterium]